MKNIYITFLVCFFPLFSFAQEKEVTEKDSILIHPVKSFQLGINSQFALNKVFKDENISPLELIFKKQIHNNQALRMRTIFDIRRWSNAVLYGSGRNQNLDNVYRIGLSVGKEWQFPIFQKWYGYFGTDLEGNLKFKLKTEESLYFEIPESKVYFQRISQKENSFSVALLPFFGISLKINERFFISSEFRINVSYTKSHLSKESALKFLRSGNEDFDFSNDFGPSTPLEPELTIREFAFEFRPYTGIFLNYRF